MAARVDIKRVPVESPIPIRTATVWDKDGAQANRKLVVTYNDGVGTPYVNICGHLASYDVAVSLGRTSCVDQYGANFGVEELEALIEILREVSDQLVAAQKG